MLNFINLVKVNTAEDASLRMWCGPLFGSLQHMIGPVADFAVWQPLCSTQIAGFATHSDCQRGEDARQTLQSSIIVILVA
jgi:hypothetical protein